MKKIYSHTWEKFIEGRGFIQGVGFDMEKKVLYILGLRFITDIRYTGTGEWLRDLKKRIIRDDEQQKNESNIRTI